MSWITIVWSAAGGACVLMVLMHVLVWSRNRRSWESLCFAITVLGVIGLIVCEMVTMHTESPVVFGRAIRWTHLVYGIGVAGSLGFVHFYFGTGKRWLLSLALGMRLLAVVMNFATGLNLDISAIQSLQKINFLGEQVSILGVWSPNPWVVLGQLASLAQFVYVVDASVRLWRTGSPESRKRAVVVGGTLAFFVVGVSGQAGLVASGVLRMPFLVSVPFLGLLLAMGYELSRDVLRAAQLGRELRESEQRMTLAADAASLGVWVRDLVRNEVWATDQWRTLLGFAKSEQIEVDRVLQKLHPEDRERIRQTLEVALTGDGGYETEYRVLLPDDRVRWIASRGRVEFNNARKPVLVRGVSLDITQRKQAEKAIEQQRDELAHLSRVTTLSTLSTSLAHELNQPLGIILSNAQAAQELLLQDPPVVTEVCEILSDIVAADRRAAEIIQRLRSLLKRGESTRHLLLLNDLIEEVLHLVRADLIGRDVTVICEFVPDLPPITGDRVQLQQLVLNLILNAADAMAANAPGTRRLHLTTTRHQHTVRASVRDDGAGLPADIESLFEPFYTTKAHGLGMGLAICRSIITAHHGRLWAEPHPERGAVFQFELPVAGTQDHP